MKKVLIFIGIIIVVLFGSDKIYKIYSSNYINSHESVVLINNFLANEDVDTFFGIKKGTYNPQLHRVIFSLRKKDANILETWLNLPTKSKYECQNGDEFKCDVKYSDVQPFGFYNYEIGNIYIVARIILNNLSGNKELNQNETISEMQIDSKYEYGKINILDVNKNGIISHCK
ncbi:MAG: hypothetical protein ACKVQV_13695 [Bacteroidia bacterium]